MLVSDCPNVRTHLPCIPIIPGMCLAGDGLHNCMYIYIHKYATCYMLQVCMGVLYPPFLHTNECAYTCLPYPYKRCVPRKTKPSLVDI